MASAPGEGSPPLQELLVGMGSAAGASCLLRGPQGCCVAGIPTTYWRKEGTHCSQEEQRWFGAPTTKQHH